MDGGGSLQIRVTVRREQTDLKSTVLSAERERCELEPTSGGDSVIACHRLWRETRRLTRTEYSLDVRLHEAWARAGLRGTD